MTLSSVSGAVAADGNVLVLACPAATITDPTAPTAIALMTTAVKDITYDLTATGLTWTTAQDSVPNDRFTNRQSFSNPGRKTVTTSLQYVYGSDDDIADPLFVEGEEYILAVRYAVDHDQEIAVGDLFDLIKVKAGHIAKDTPAANTNLSKTLTLFPQAEAVDDVALV